MYPLNALIIGCTDRVLSDLRPELTNLSVNVEGEFDDVRSCLAHDLPHILGRRLLVVHPKSEAEITQVERLNESFVGQPILALVDPTNDPSLMMRAMRAGAAQVVRLPLQKEDFGAAIHRIAIQFGHPVSQTRTIMVLGASEGSGTTTISLNLASEIGRLRKALCILAEGATNFGRLASYFGIDPAVTIYDLLCDVDHLDVETIRRALTKVEDHLQVLTGPYQAITPREFSSESVLKLLSIGRELAEIVVIDGRYSYDEVTFDFASKIQQLVLVARPTVPSLHNLRLLRETLAQRECLAEQFIVINQLDRKAKGFSAPQLAKILDVPKVFTVDADSASFLLAENAGRTLRKVAIYSSAYADIVQLAQAVAGTSDQSLRIRWPLLGKLTHFVQSLNPS